MYLETLAGPFVFPIIGYKNSNVLKSLRLRSTLVFIRFEKISYSRFNILADFSQRVILVERPIIVVTFLFFSHKMTKLTSN